MLTDTYVSHQQEDIAETRIVTWDTYRNIEIERSYIILALSWVTDPSLKIFSILGSLSLSNLLIVCGAAKIMTKIEIASPQLSTAMASSPTDWDATKASIDQYNVSVDAADTATEGGSRTARGVRLSHQNSPTANVRKAIQHATPPTGCGSPMRRSIRTTLRDADSSITIPFHLADETHNADSPTSPSNIFGRSPPPSFNPPNAITQSQSLEPLTDSHSNPVVALPPQHDTTPAPPKSNPTSKKRVDRLEENRKAVLNNDIFTWARKTTFDKGDVEVDSGLFDVYVRYFTKQLRVRFQETRSTKKSREKALGERSLRSATSDSNLIDDEAKRLETTNIKRVSRCHFEDLVGYVPGQKLAVYIAKDSHLITDVFSGVPNKARLKQKRDGIAGDIVVVASRKFIVLKATIVEAKAHIDCVAGAINLKQFKKFFSKSEGFAINLDGTSEQITFSWMDVISMAEDVYFFGPPLNGARRYEKLFVDKHREDYVKQVFHDMSRETFGDVYASSALLVAY